MKNYMLSKYLLGYIYKKRSTELLIILRFWFISLCYFFTKKNLFIFNINNKRLFYLSSFCLVKNEGPYIREWIAFNYLMGVEHFFIYDNGSTDETENKINPFIKMGICTFKKLTSKPAMPSALYEACNLDFATNWMMAFDIDEFLLEKTVPLLALLNDFENFPALAINWRYFGNAGIKNEGNSFVIETFLRSDNRIDPHVKLIFKPEYLKKAINSHFNLYKNNKRAVDTCKNEVFGTFNNKKPHDKLILNHYVIGSQQRFFSKAATHVENIWDGRQISKRRSLETWENEKLKFNNVKNDEMLKYVPRLKSFLDSL